MRSFLLALCATFILPWAWAGTAITPNTTLAAETGNNTSAANTFTTSANGNLGASNISKLPLRSLLYPGSTTKIYAHFMAWFGGSSHINIGYTSNDANQVRKQLDDMQSRGIDGLIIDWYGPNGWREEQTAQLIRPEAERRAGFEFAIMEDQGSIAGCGNTAGCDVTAAIIGDLTYAYNAYATSPAYMKRNGRPVMFFFGVENFAIDWNRVRAGVPGNPIFIFQNSSGFTRSQSGGAFAWLSIQTSNYSTFESLPYLQGFYSAALANSTQIPFGSAFKGFNDILASWAPPGGRHVAQLCGQTWLDSWAQAGSYYSASRQLANLQVVTWNDYEEATEFESGIDNCVTVSALMINDTLSWSITGSEKTIDHYRVFISTDGTNLMSVADVPVGTHALSLSSYGFAAGTYKLFVKAVGKASIRNQMSAAVSYSVVATSPTPGPQPVPPPTPTPTPTPTPAPPTPPTPAPSPNASSTGDMKFAAAPTAVSVSQGRDATVLLSIAPSTSFTGTVTFACKNLPENASCTFAPAIVAAGKNGGSTWLTVATAQKVKVGSLRDPFGLGLSFAGVFGIVVVFDARARRRLVKFAATSAITFLILSQVGCGATSSLSQPLKERTMLTPTGTFTVTITATSGTLVRTTNVSMTVNK